MISIGQLSKTILTTIKKNSPVILTTVASFGVITTGVLAGQATYKAYLKLEEERSYLEDGDLTKQQKLKAVWPYYVPPVVMGITTIACIVGAQSVQSRRIAAIASAYSIADASLKDYKTKVFDTLGEKKATEIRDSIAQDKLDRHPVGDAKMYYASTGETLCYDSITGRYFQGDQEKIRKAVNDLNQELLGDTWVSLNRFYNLLGLDEVKYGDDTGWVPDNLLEVSYSAKISTDGRPCIVLDYMVEPKHDPYR